MSARNSERATRILAAAGPTMSLPELGKVLGIGRAHVYELARRDELPVRVLRLGNRLVVPSADVRRLLGVDEPGGTAA